MNFFLDHNMPRGLANALKALAAPRDDHDFKHFRDVWPENDPGDPVWIPEVAAWSGGWRLISGDRRILTTPQNQAALRSSGLIAFFMTKNFARHDRWQQASLFFSSFRAIEKAAMRAKRGALFHITEHGKVDPVRSF